MFGHIIAHFSALLLSLLTLSLCFLPTPALPWILLLLLQIHQHAMATNDQTTLSNKKIGLIQYFYRLFLSPGQVQSIFQSEVPLEQYSPEISIQVMPKCLRYGLQARYFYNYKAY